MNRAQQRGAALRQDLGLSGCIDAEAVAVSLGLEVHPWPLEVLSELQVDGVVAVAKRLDPEWRRWVIAHAIGHWLLHPGNHLWLRKNTDVPVRYEREAEDFARALLVDEREALEERLVRSWEVAEHFGVPDELVRQQASLLNAPEGATLEDGTGNT